MNIYTGRKISDGFAIGKIYKIRREIPNIEEIADDPDAERKRLIDSIVSVQFKLRDLCDKAFEMSEIDAGELFIAQEVLLEDPMFLGPIVDYIENEKRTAEYALINGIQKCMEIFEQMDDDYIKQRGIDIKATADMVLDELLRNDEILEVDGPVILLSDDITVEQIITVGKKNILAMIVKNGSINSHASIMARSMDIPMLINVDVDMSGVMNGCDAAVDSEKQSLYLFPDEATIKDINEKIDQKRIVDNGLEEYRGLHTITKSGRYIKLLANANSVDDVLYIKNNGAEGIGLYRTEYLYFREDKFLDEDEQFFIYKKMLEDMGDKKVIIRTFDLGADKMPKSLAFDKEDNPALGLRGIRLALKQREMFETQLRALFRASEYGNMCIMFPMITTEDEVRKILEIINDVKCDLEYADIKYNAPKIGIMIETPAAAIISDKLAPMVDFFSIGTNDLTQYTLGVDRQNPKVADLYDFHHKAVLELIEMVVKNAHKHGVEVGICGELASDETMTKYFMDIGVDELSVSAAKILPLRKMIRDFD